MAKTDHVELPDGERVPILFEDRSVLAIDKPPGWMLGPEDEEHIRHNLHLALTAGIEAGEWWARCRSLKFIRFVHRLDAPTTGVLLMAKSRGAIAPLGRLFASRDVSKRYLAVTDGVPRETQWTCSLPLGPVPRNPGRHRVDLREGKPAETRFTLLETRGNRALIEAVPLTGRTHQIRLHLAAAGCPVAGDHLYGAHDDVGLGLRAIELAYADPFTGRPVRIRAPIDGFKEAFGFGPLTPPPAPTGTPGNPLPAPRPPAVTPTAAHSPTTSRSGARPPRGTPR